MVCWAARIYFVQRPGKYLTHLHVTGVDGSCLASDVTIAGASVCQEHVSKLLPSLPHHHYPLIVAGPGQVLDGPRDGLELVLEDVLLVDRVPDPHLAALVGAGNVEPAGTVLGNIDLGAVLGVDVGDLKNNP